MFSLVTTTSDNDQLYAYTIDTSDLTTSICGGELDVKDFDGADTSRMEPNNIVWSET